MHILTKLTLGAGAVLLIGSIIAMVVGGGSFMGEFADNPNGTEKWGGTSPTNYEGEFAPMPMNIYYVFVEDGATVDVELVGGDADNAFVPCEEYDECEYYKWAGYTYVGNINVMTEGNYEVNFTGEGDVMIREHVLDLGGVVAMGLGFWGICCSFCVLGLGIIFIFTLKDNKMQQGVMMVQQSDGTFQQVGGIGTPTQGEPMVAGGVHPAFAQEQPAQQQTIIQQHGQQPPNQGF